MEMKDTEQKLKSFIARYRALADVPYRVVHGRSITPREALVILQRDEVTPKIVATISMATPNSPQQEWQLVKAFYRMLLSRPGPHLKIYWIGGEMTLEEALAHVRVKDAKVYPKLLSMYQGLEREMVQRMK